jgi:hypothetical protein
MKIVSLLFLPVVFSCSGKRLGGNLPNNHVSVDCPNKAPTVPYVDAAGEAQPWEDLPYGDFALPKYIANLSTAYATDLCYYSQQVLPSPPSGVQPDGNCTWDTSKISVTDVFDLEAIGSQAISRMQQLAIPGISAFRGSQCGSGSSNIRALCSVAPDSKKCTPALLNQISLWAVAASILEMTEETLPSVIANDTLWRNSVDFHGVAIASNLVQQKGWGSGGQISFKIIPCVDIPSTLFNIAFDCSFIDPSTGNQVYDEAFNFWSTYKAPSWLKRELDLFRSKNTLYRK